MSKVHVSTTINGDAVEVLCEPEQSLLDVLRDEIALTGTKEGCATGDCGACSVLVNGRLVCACLMLGVEADGQELTTIEGIAGPDGLHVIQQKYLEHAALQCGICTPGFIVATKALLDKNPDPDEDHHPLLAGRQPVPLHRLRQDRPRRAGIGGGTGLRGLSRRQSGSRRRDEKRNHPKTEDSRRSKWRKQLT